MIKAENVKKVFGTGTVLEDVNLTVNPGEVVTILGSSGSGKSTLIRCINGLEKLDGGRIIVDEFDIAKPKELAEARKRSGVVYADVDGPAAIAWLQAAQAHALVHGHTHRPADHVLAPGLARHVLSDWDLAATPPRADVLRLTAAGLERIALAPR